MSGLTFASPLWSRALTLAERHRLLAERVPSGIDKSAFYDSTSDPDSASALMESGRRRFERWQAQSPFSEESYFAQRLANDGVSPERLLAILSAPIETLHEAQGDRPRWLAQVEDAYSNANRADDEEPFDEPLEEPFDDPMDGSFDETSEAEDEEVNPEAGAESELLAFLELVRPLVDQACERLDAGIAEIVERTFSGDAGSLPFDPATIEEILLMNLLEPLLMRLSRTLVLELHVARLQGHLAGDTPQERFVSFIEQLRQPEVALAILAEYPVLTRQLLICINQWVEVSLEFVERLCDDWQMIQAEFANGEEIGVLDELAGGAGDTHRGGRSVMIATFASGFRIVYKPKSMKIDLHFQELLLWLNEKGCDPPIQLMKVVDRGEYGWVEFVQYQSCRTRDELERFFLRHGACLALLYALNSNDFHYENLIAAGEDPWLIDLETLLQPRFDTFDETQAEFAAEKVMAESVLQVGLLPMRMWSNDDYIGIDISGLGGMAGQLSPDRLPQITDVGTDAMRYIRERVEIAGVANRPSLNGVEARAGDYIEEIVIGFTSVFQLLMTQRAELLAADGPLQRFAEDEIRVLLRPTRTYDQLLSESFHPDLLHDALDRQLFLDRLWMAATIRPYLAEVIASEQADMQRGDIPIFTSHPTSLELFGNSHQGIAGVLYESGMNAVRRRIALLNEREMKRQIWFIRASIATLDSDNESANENNNENNNESDHQRTLGQVVPEATAAAQLVAKKPEREELLAGVQTIVDQLAATAIYGLEDVTWIGLELLNQQAWAIRQLGTSLSSGLCGVALFLAYAGEISGDEESTALARSVLNNLLSQIEMFPNDRARMGALDGWGGILYTMTHLAHLWDDESVVAQATAIVETIANVVSQDEQFNIGQGSAGALIALLHLARTKGIARALEVAILCGDHLLSRAKESDGNIGWEPLAASPSVNEFLYGDRGISWALLELAAATGDERYAVAAKAAMQDDVIADATSGDETPQPLTSHGGTAELGKLFARYQLSKHLDESTIGPEIGPEVERGVALLQLYEGAEARSLTPEEIGLLDFLLVANLAEDNEQTTAIVDQLGALLLENIEQQSWQCSSPRGIEIPGLMTGLSALGYGLLRLADPGRVPALFLLASPLS